MLHGTAGSPNRQDYNTMQYMVLYCDVHYTVAAVSAVMLHVNYQQAHTTAVCTVPSLIHLVLA